MTLKTLNLKEAALLLKMTPEGLRRKVAAGKIPGAKPGKCWCFREDDLADYLRSLYSNCAKASWGVQPKGGKIWHSTNEITLGGSLSITSEKEYKKALALP